MNNKIISVDLGGTKILSAIVNKNAEILGRHKLATDATKGTEFLVNSIAESVNNVLKENNVTIDEIEGISLGVPGTVNPMGIIGRAPNLNIVNYNIKEALKKYFDVPVYIENDVNLAALGIKKFEFQNKVNNMLVVFVGTGIGSALILNGNIYRGSSFYAGEIGHIVINQYTNDKEYKKKITFENVASRTAIVKSITKDIEKGKESYLKKFVDAGKKIKSKSLLKAVNKNDKLAIKHLNKACNILGTVTANITTLLNIDTIVFGGGVIEALDFYMLPLIEEQFKKMVLPEPGKIVSIKSTKLGDDAAIFGGLALFEEFKVKEG